MKRLPGSASTRILLALAAGLVAGSALSAFTPSLVAAVTSVADPVGSLWLSALRMTIVPLVFSLLVTGIASTAHTASAGGLAARALIYFVVVLLAAALFGELAVAAFLHAWPIPAAAAEAMRSGIGADAASLVPTPGSLSVWLVSIIPTNPIKAAADGEMLPLVLFALMFAFAVASLARERARLLVDVFQAIVDAMLVIVGWVILAAPVGVFALALVLGARAGFVAAGALAHYLVLLVLVQVLLIVLIYPCVALGARIAMPRFARAAAPAQALAVSTQSSLACLPSMVEASAQLQVPVTVTGLVLPLAVSVFRITSPVANIAVVLYSASLFGVDLSFTQYAAGAVIALVMSFASVGLPGQVSFFTSIAPICLVMGVPVLALPLLLAVETIPDIFRTIGNVTGDIGMTAVLARHVPTADEPATDEALPG